MKSNRLRLHRETLRELSREGLEKAAGGQLTMTCYSCLQYISCNVAGCVINGVTRTTTAVSG